MGFNKLFLVSALFLSTGVAFASAQPWLQRVDRGSVNRNCQIASNGNITIQRESGGVTTVESRNIAFADANQGQTVTDWISDAVKLAYIPYPTGLGQNIADSDFSLSYEAQGMPLRRSWGAITLGWRKGPSVDSLIAFIDANCLN